MADYKGSSGRVGTAGSPSGFAAPQENRGTATIADKVRDTAADAWHKTEDLASGAVDSVKGAAQSVAHAAEHAYDATKEKTGELADSLTCMIRRNPVPAVLVGLGLGFLIGTLLSARR